MATRDEIMALPIVELGLGRKSRDYIIEFAWAHSPEKGPLPPHGRQRTTLFNEFASTLTVEGVIRISDSLVQKKLTETSGLSWRYIQRRELHIFCRKLQEMGLNQLDWIALESDAVTTKMLRNLSKEKLLQMSILVLGTLNPKAIDRYLNHRKDMAIGTFLKTSQSVWSRGSNFVATLRNTRRKLFEMGLGYDDGIFLQEGTKRALAERLMRTYGLTQDVATSVAEVAEKEKWVKSFEVDERGGL